MTRAIRQLIDDARVEPGPAIERFLGAHSFPLTDGTTTTFVFRGDADEVLLRHWIYGLPSTQPFERLDGTDLWHLVMELPERSRIEYKLEVVKDGRRRLILDPLNRNTAHDPYGQNSVCHGLGYETPEWTHPDPDARPGAMRDLLVDSAAFGEARTVRVYIPARLRRGRACPLLIVHDGDDYVRYARLKTILDNLIFRFEIPQLVVALTQSPARLGEYAADRRHAAFLAQELLPRLESEFSIDPEPGARALMGASFGAVASLATAWYHPGIFGRLILQSGSFAFTDIGTRHGRGPVFDPVVEFMNAFREAPGRFTDKVFVSCGRYESLIYENRSLVPLLHASGVNLRYVEAPDGHNWENWRDRLREGLAWTFPGPLWMVYE
jgi:enterochelin esterase family protein